MSDITIAIIAICWATFVIILDFTYGREELKRDFKHLYEITLYRVMHPIRIYKMRKLIKQILAENDQLLRRLKD